MQFLSLRLFVFVAVIVASTSSAISQTNNQQTCQFESQIIELAERLIDIRPEMPGFSAARFGPDAAYLLLRYGNTTTSRGLALIDQIRNDGARQPYYLNELGISFAISRLGVREGLSITGENALEIFAKGDRPVMRAIILSDGGPSFFDLLRELEDFPELAHDFRQTYMAGMQLPIVISDQSDAFKFEFAQRAEINDEIVLAGMVLANLSDLSEYRRFLGRYSDNEFVSRMAGESNAFANSLTLISQNGPTELIRSLPDIVREQKQIDFDIYKAGFLSMETDTLGIVLNLAGRDESASAVASAARRYLSALQAGSITPSDDPEAAWLFIHQALIEALGMQTTFQALSKFELSRQLRHFAGTALQTMDWVVAKDAVAPYLRGEANAMPLRPVILSAEFDWDEWTRIVTDVRSLKKLPTTLVGELETQMAIEMLYLRGEIDLAIALAARDLPPETRRYVYVDIMKRLDLRCDAYTNFPGKAILLGGATLYRFPQNP